MRGSVNIDNKILTELPTKRGFINWKATVGMFLDLLYKDKVYSVKVLDYINKKNKLLIDYNGFIKEDGISCGNFKNGSFGGILNITQSSKNRFKYSEEHKCWFGWTTKDKKFAFDGDDETVKYILNNTWYIGKNNVMNGRNKEPLHRIVWGEKTDVNFLICFKSNELNLRKSFYDNRKCNLIQKEIKNNTTIINDIECSHKIKEMFDCYQIEVNGKYIKIDKNEAILNKLKKWKIHIVKYNGKHYASCTNKSNTKLLHRILFDLLDIKYNNWHIDHINGNGLDNRMVNLIITDRYGNMYNVKGKGYNVNKSGNYQVRCMSNYPDENLFKNSKRQPVYKNEEEAINEVNRRRKYVMEHRIKFHSKEELDIYLERLDENN